MAGKNRDWGLDDANRQPPSEVAADRDEIDRRVAALFEEIGADGLDASG